MLVLLFISLCLTTEQSKLQLVLSGRFCLVSLSGSEMSAFDDPTLAVQTLKLTRYQDLSEWHLCASEQKELCQNLIDSGLSVNAWSSRHSMNYSSMKRYMRKYQLWQSSGIDTFHNSGGGRPPIIDDTGIINIRKNLRENLASQSCQQSMILCKFFCIKITIRTVAQHLALLRKLLRNSKILHKILLKNERVKNLCVYDTTRTHEHTHGGKLR